MSLLVLAQANPTPWYLDPVFLPAASALLGVILGGVISSGFSYFIEERRAEREQERDEKLRRLEVKRAARVIGDDFAGAIAIPKISRERKRWTAIGANLTLDSWKNYKAALAADFDLIDWALVCGAASSIEELQDMRKKFPNLVWDDEGSKDLQEMENHIQAGIDALKKYE